MILAIPNNYMQNQLDAIRFFQFAGKLSCPVDPGTPEA